MVEDARAQTLRHVSSAYLTYVAVDAEGNRIAVPSIVPETNHQKRRYEDAERRRELRAVESKRVREVRVKLGGGWNL